MSEDRRARRWKPPVWGRDGLTLGQRLKLARERRGLTQKDVSQRFRFYDSQLSRWEGDYKLVNLAVFAELSRLYRVPLDSLYFGPLPADGRGDGE